MIHATYVFHTRTLCGKNTSDSKVEKLGSMGWDAATCPECRSKILDQLAMDEAERAASRRFQF